MGNARHKKDKVLRAGKERRRVSEADQERSLDFFIPERSSGLSKKHYRREKTMKYVLFSLMVFFLVAGVLIVEFGLGRM